MSDMAVQLAVVVKKYLTEYDTPAPDFLYRIRLREQMRNALASFENENAVLTGKASNP